MPRRRVEVPLCPCRAWVWAADAEWRWQRVVRLLLALGGEERAAAEPEEPDGQQSGGLRAGLGRPSGRAPDD